MAGLSEVNATNRPVAETDGSRLGPAALPFVLREITSVLPVVRSHASTIEPTLVNPAGAWYVKATTLPSAEIDGSRALPPPGNPAGNGSRRVLPCWRSRTNTAGCGALPAGPPTRFEPDDANAT